MADPITMAIATAVAGGVAQSLSDQARETVAALVRHIKEKFHASPAAQAALAAAVADPGSAAGVSQLASALDEAAAADHEFGRRIRELWGEIRLAVSARDDATVNAFTGQAEKVVQLRDVQGDISIS